jgi:Na+-translocating ferredoxin:NAD+ oxidoreductase subunit B
MTALLLFTLLALGFGGLLAWASHRFKIEGNPLVEQIDALLPQTQCGQCGYPGCKPYANAVASGEADINLCIPGGEVTVIALSELTGREVKPLAAEAKPKQIAFIKEEDCIGCVKCITACPVDAILGAAKFTHTVIAHECTGCELCIPVCPTDCIIMENIPLTPQNWQWDKPKGAVGEKTS